MTNNKNYKQVRLNSRKYSLTNRLIKALVVAAHLVVAQGTYQDYCQQPDDFHHIQMELAIADVYESTLKKPDEYDYWLLLHED